MNDQLENFRRRLKSDDVKKERIKLWDLISPTISLTALIISATTAYFNLLWQSDDIRAVVSGLNFSVSAKTGLQVGEVPEWTFINSGNRAAAIRGLKLVITKSLDCLKADEAEIFRYEVDPFVIKPSEILPKTFHVATGASSSGPGWLTTVKGDTISLLMCATATIMTPDSVQTKIALPLWIILVTLEQDTQSVHVVEAPMFNEEKPQPLYTRRFGLSTVLRSWWNDFHSAFSDNTHMRSQR